PQGAGNFGLEHRSVDTDNNTLIALICRAVLLGCPPHRRGTAPIDNAESSPNVVSFATPARFPEVHMSQAARLLLLVICAVQLFFAVAFFFQWPLAVNIWPFKGTTPLTYIFIASIFAA